MWTSGVHDGSPFVKVCCFRGAIVVVFLSIDALLEEEVKDDLLRFFMEATTSILVARRIGVLVIVAVFSQWRSGWCALGVMSDVSLLLFNWVSNYIVR